MSVVVHCSQLDRRNTFNANGSFSVFNDNIAFLAEISLQQI